MKKRMIVTLAATLAGCHAQLDDLTTYVAEVKQNTPVNIEPYPEFTAMPAHQYQGASLRSPFQRPKTLTLAVVEAAKANCLQPNVQRQKQPLERYGLDALSLSGVFTSKGKRWALIKANDGSLHQVTTGDYMGLFLGKITAIKNGTISLTEMLPDGAGCWQKKQASISMTAKAGEDNNV